MQEERERERVINNRNDFHLYYLFLDESAGRPDRKSEYNYYIIAGFIIEYCYVEAFEKEVNKLKKECKIEGEIKNGENKKKTEFYEKLKDLLNNSFKDKIKFVGCLYTPKAEDYKIKFKFSKKENESYFIAEENKDCSCFSKCVDTASFFCTSKLHEFQKKSETQKSETQNSGIKKISTRFAIIMDENRTKKDKSKEADKLRISILIENHEKNSKYKEYGGYGQLVKSFCSVADSEQNVCIEVADYVTRLIKKANGNKVDLSSYKDFFHYTCTYKNLSTYKKCTLISIYDKKSRIH